MKRLIQPVTRDDASIVLYRLFLGQYRNSSLLTPRSSLLPIKNMQLRNLTIPYAQPAVFAPMAGFTDAACRHLMADHGAAWTVSEMASAKAITFGDDKSVRLLRDKASHGIYAVQLLSLIHI